MLSMTRLALGTRVIELSLRGKASLAATMGKYRRMWKPTEPQNWAVDYQEKYIPFSKNQLVDALVKEFHSSNHEERISFLQFVSQVDSSLVHHYYSVLEQLKVTVNLDQYEYITFWALGQRIGPLRVMTATRAQRRGFFGTAWIPADRHYFKRVIVAARTKNAHLVLKCFKDIPLEGLEQLLPSIKVRTSIFYRALLNTMLIVSGLALFVNVGMVVLSDLKIGTTTLLFFFAALMAFRAWKVFGQRRNIHSLELVHMLYYRSTSNNSELLDALTLRAQEEHAKEVILAHSFLLRCHRQHQHPLPQETGVEADPKPIEHLREQVEAWLRLRSGLEINFCAERACKHLKELGVRGAAHPVVG
ncbi:transmembrane protein 143 isoform X2 [Candoia aspera]|uniref:transmembrane protein 143 isoform X2 n=1 Tax=Candoia aspera TaxID=51853 RepID=UPI002FD848FD